MALPKKYSWLAKETGPKMLLAALLEYGTLEGPGNANNPKILSWAAEVGGNVDDIYKADSIPWCGLFMAVIAKRAGKIAPKDPLWALNWGTFGTHVEKNQAMLGDILVFVRNGGGHVGMYIGESKDTFHVLGGNTSDQVKITEISKARLYTVRRPIYSIGIPPNVRKVFISASGEISTNEK